MVFDLDDTLVPVAQQLALAQAALLEFMGRRMPNSYLMAQRAMKDLMAEYVIHTYIYAFIHTYMHIRMPTYIHAHIHTYIHMHSVPYWTSTY